MVQLSGTAYRISRTLKSKMALLVEHFKFYQIEIKILSGHFPAPTHFLW